MADSIKYHFIYTIAYLFSLLPLRALYLFSDVCYIVLYYVIGYRIKVVRKNLSNSFPEKAEQERRDIEKGFYRWFCDYIFETIKLTSMSEAEMRRRMQFVNIDEINAYASQNRSICLYLGHYCNWEWVSSLGLYFAPFPHLGQIYHELESKAADRFFLKIRERFGVKCIKMEDTLPVIRGYNNTGQPHVVGYISDQVPGFHSMHYWPTFLNQLTPTYSGPERIAKIFDNAVFYVDIKRPKRGYYVATMVKMSDGAKAEPKFSLTEKYYRLLENSINENPYYWLWSHNRWKRTWEDFCANFPDEAERKRILSKL